ncbi:class A beta-lactamase-related serine hydrolase [Flagellimonas lutimaris]|uniref:Class A beta-lactamase-related serine hydrolase n=2 Tax=Flagellimonas lutimaris TaxID=475082 RepID=A0A3A1N3E0_9FLAO|nr:class A beta-lactamase-related serine hydrolase [Allomuricauda lutimaris]
MYCMRALLSLLCIVMGVYSLQSQQQTDSITKELKRIQESSNLVGFAVAIVNKDSIVYSKGFGYSNKEQQKPYTTKTVQPIASISKTLLGVALMKAQEMGLLDLDDPINDHLSFTIQNPFYPNEPITIRQLANHTSSILDTEHYNKIYIFNDSIPPFYENLPQKSKLGVKQEVDLFNNNQMMPVANFIKNQYCTDGKWYTSNSFSNTVPGSTYDYSNMGANIAAFIIAEVSDMEYTKFLQKYILNPIQMDNSGWASKDHPLENASKLYWYGNPIPQYEFITYGDGGFMTNIEDFSKYLIEVMKGYNGESNILKASSYKEMLSQPVSKEFKKNVFWTIDDEKIGHSGNDPGIISHAYFLREGSHGIIVFVNTSEVENDMISVRDIYRTLLKHM